MTKERLRAYRDLKIERDQLKSKIEELSAELYSPRSQQLDGMPHSGSKGDNAKLDAQIDRKDEVLKLYKQKEAALTAAMLEVEEAILVLEPRERTLIRLYYLEGLTWEQVAVKMSYSWRQVHRIHGKTLEILKGNK